MRKVILVMHVSLDGFVAGPNGEMDWISYDQELEQYVHSLHSTTDAALFGRVTYQMMEGYWPTVLSNPESTQAEINHATWLNQATKIIFSRTLEKVDWTPSLVIKENIAETMTALKQQPGKDFMMVGSTSIAQTFMRLGLIDEYWLNINPVVLGSGMRLFDGLDDSFQLKLLETRMFKCGVAGLRYAAVK